MQAITNMTVYHGIAVSGVAFLVHEQNTWFFARAAFTKSSDLFARAASSVSCSDSAFMSTPSGCAGAVATAAGAGWTPTRTKS